MKDDDAQPASASCIWLLCSRQSVCYGHGSYGEEWRLVTDGGYGAGPPLPAFETKRKAKEFLRGLAAKKNGSEWGLVPVRVELRR